MTPVSGAAADAGIGWLGGSFDPIHLGHMHLATTVVAKLGLRRLYLVPAGQNPLKSGTQAAAGARLEMVRLAVAEAANPALDVLDWEVRAPGPSYTVETAQRLVERFGQPISLVLGNEVFADLARWKEPAKLLALANLVVIRRTQGTSFDSPAVLARLGLTAVADPAVAGRYRVTETGRVLTELEIYPLPFSSTAIREALGKSRAAEADMPPGVQRSVWRFIKENRLYAVK